MISKVYCYLQVGVFVAFGLVVGFAASWWINHPTPPWLEFHSIAAIYERGSTVVKVRGVYTAHKECSREGQNVQQSSPAPLVWRQEVEGTGPEVVSYAPRPEAPELKIGTHEFFTEIPLNEGISPDGWHVAVLVSCGTEPLAIRSRSEPVKFIASRG